MKETWFSIAGMSFQFISHGVAAEYLFDELPGLLTGFLITKKKAVDAVCHVHFDHEKTYRQRFDSQANIIRRQDAYSTDMVIGRMEEIFFPFPKNYSEAIGFLNGCLIFDDRINRGAIYVFSSDGANQFVGTLLKLLFVFTSMVMVNRGRIMVHGTGIKRRNRGGGYLFLGNSGAGKSTIAALSSGDAVLSDDATVIEVVGDACRIHATPFRQVDIAREPRKRLYMQQEKLDKILFLQQSSATYIQPREQRMAFTELLTKHVHSFEVMGESLKRQAFHLCHAVFAKTPAYDLFFRKDPGFWELVLTR